LHQSVCYLLILENKMSKFDTTFAYTIEEATRIATCGRTLLYAAIKSGSLKARKMGRRTIILDADLR
jgi:hypothetical protein